MYNFLNCQVHLTGTKPQVGLTYNVHTPLGNSIVYYHGCVNSLSSKTIQTLDDPAPGVLTQLAGRYYTKEFYVADYEKYIPPFPETLTTIYWSPFIRTDEKGEAEFSFYTNDLSGRFILIAEGISTGGVLSGKKIFSVKK